MDLLISPLWGWLSINSSWAFLAPYLILCNSYYQLWWSASKLPLISRLLRLIVANCEGCSDKLPFAFCALSALVIYCPQSSGLVALNPASTVCLTCLFLRGMYQMLSAKDTQRHWLYIYNRPRLNTIFCFIRSKLVGSPMQNGRRWMFCWYRFWQISPLT